MRSDEFKHSDTEKIGDFRQLIGFGDSAADPSADTSRIGVVRLSKSFLRSVIRLLDQTF